MTAILPATAAFDVSGRVALVTGAFSGLGLHFAGVLAQHGAKVAMAGRRIELGRRLAEQVGREAARPADVRAYALDVTSAESVRECMRQVVDELGSPRVLVNNAGIISRAPTVVVDEEDWNAVLDVNLSGAFRVAKAAAVEMVRAGQGGSIVNVASILGLRVRPGVAAYAASKAAVIQLTKLMALEWAEHGIRVNALAPGYFDTELNGELLRSEAGQAILSRVPQKRAGQLQELNGALVLLASDASSYMTGAVIPVDGGHLVSTL